mmetsp:Transcript_57685/g.153734  ORF Transcript_57685/g.153734 Transcript_57685/m.153734 type:complete len:269 (-) Transcript_57685:918-1724(-)
MYSDGVRWRKHDTLAINTHAVSVHEPIVQRLCTLASSKYSDEEHMLGERALLSHAASRVRRIARRARNRVFHSHIYHQSLNHRQHAHVQGAHRQGTKRWQDSAKSIPRRVPEVTIPYISPCNDADVVGPVPRCLNLRLVYLLNAVTHHCHDGRHPNRGADAHEHPCDVRRTVSNGEEQRTPEDVREDVAHLPTHHHLPATHLPSSVRHDPRCAHLEDRAEYVRSHCLLGAEAHALHVREMLGQETNLLHVEEEGMEQEKRQDPVFPHQ